MLSLGLNIYLVFRFHDNQNSGIVKENIPKYKLTNPLQKENIDSNVESSDAVLHYSGLREILESEIERFGAKENTGFFLQDIRTGAWLGVKEREGFNPASLLKIPLMMAMLKKVKLDEISLDSTLEITEEDLDKNSGRLHEKGVGYKMTVWDFIEEMILSSDNTAKNVLKRQLNDAELNSVFAHVGIPNPYSQSGDSLVTPRGYTRLFKSLYYSSYLSPELSEKALEITTDTKMENLISAGIPYEIQVAHKYGERSNGLSDCGIVYHPQNAYFVCAMTRDMEIPQARDLIVSLSKIVYTFISEKNTDLQN